MPGPDAEQDVFRRPAASVNVPPQLSSLGRMNTLASWARTARPGTPPGAPPRRWAHVQGVAARARGLAPVLGADADLLEAAAWLHDIGYAPSLATTGLHQLDGARYLRDAQRADAMLCRLVAHHSCAIIEAGERGLAEVLSLEFEPAPDVLASVLTCCDMTTSPDGQPVRVEQAARRDTRTLRLRAPGEPVHPARHADDPLCSRAGPSKSRPDHIAPRIGCPVPSNVNHRRPDEQA